MNLEELKLVPFNCRPLDEMMSGGIESGCLTLIYGEAGTGKTNLCLTLAKNLALGGRKTVYVDSEGISLLRLRMICLLYTSDAADDLLCVDLGGRRIINKHKQ